MVAYGGSRRNAVDVDLPACASGRQNRSQGSIISFAPAGARETLLELVTHSSRYGLRSSARYAGYDARRVAQGGGAATKLVGPSSAGPGPNAVRPYIACKLLAKITRIYGIAMQGPPFGPAAFRGVRVFLPRRKQDNRNSHGPRRQNHGAVERPQGWRASLALPFFCVSPLCGLGANLRVRVHIYHAYHSTFGGFLGGKEQINEAASNQIRAATSLPAVQAPIDFHYCTWERPFLVNDTTTDKTARVLAAPLSPIETPLPATFCP